jgi:hypothetical protein
MGIMLLMSVGAARADTLQFVVSELAGSATFDLLQNPTVTSFSSGNYFTVTVNNGSINLLGYSFCSAFRAGVLEYVHRRRFWLGRANFGRFAAERRSSVFWVRFCADPLVLCGTFPFGLWLGQSDGDVDA